MGISSLSRPRLEQSLADFPPFLIVVMATTVTPCVCTAVGFVSRRRRSEEQEEQTDPLPAWEELLQVSQE